MTKAWIIVIIIVTPSLARNLIDIIDRYNRISQLHESNANN